MVGAVAIDSAALEHAAGSKTVREAASAAGFVVAEIVAPEADAVSAAYAGEVGAAAAGVACHC